MEPAPSTNNEKIQNSKDNFVVKSKTTSYNFIIINKNNEITFKLQDINEFPIKLYELKITYEKLKEEEENFNMFKTVEKFITILNKCIQSENYSLNFDKEKNIIIFEIKNEFFENGSAKIKIPWKEQDLKSQVEALTKIVCEMRKEIKNSKFINSSKDEVAKESFNQTSILEEEDKILLSKWIHPNKVIRFKMLFSTEKDNDNSSTFHYYCDGIFPTITIILDTKGRKFGGYNTNNWLQPPDGEVYSRAQDSFIFNLSKKQKFELLDNLDVNAIYKSNAYGPTFGCGHDISLVDACRSNNNSYCSKSSYNTGDVNVLGNKDSTKFQVANYEVYQVIFE